MKILAIDMPLKTRRENARQHCRAAIRQVLGQRFSRPPETFELIAEPGLPPTIRGYPEVGVSISHEAGLSLIALNFSGPVGIDLLSIEYATLVGPEMRSLSNDYLGSEVAIMLGKLPPTQRVFAFARAWTGHEARLKCLGLGLEEWSAGLEARLAACSVHWLELPKGYVGAIAVLPPAGQDAAITPADSGRSA